MHIEPGLVSPDKLLLAYATATASSAILLSQAARDVRTFGFGSFTLRALAATAAVFVSFQVLPHFPVGVSEVHFIFGAALFLLLGPAAAGFGLGAGLLAQGLLFQPHDLPQYAMNLTTLLVPLIAMSALARKIVPSGTTFAGIGYGQALQLSALYQAGIVSWVAFWAFYGGGFTADSLAAVATFGTAYASVLILEPAVELGCLALAKRFSTNDGFFGQRLSARA